jgi:CTP:molybdopterin cytidylyltransferase MocA
MRRVTSRARSGAETAEDSIARRVAAVVLAAGGASRYGSLKQIALLNGIPLVRRAALAAASAGLDPVIVVAGKNHEFVEHALIGLERTTVIVNDKWQSGQASSLRAGLDAASAAECDGALIMLSDQPLIGRGALDRILAGFSAGHRIVAAAFNKTIGAPVVFGSEFFDDLRKLDGDSGAGKWLRERPSLVTPVQLPEAATDIDTTSDMDAILERD